MEGVDFSCGSLPSDVCLPRHSVFKYAYEWFGQHASVSVYGRDGHVSDDSGRTSRGVAKHVYFDAAALRRVGVTHAYLSLCIWLAGRISRAKKAA